VPGTPVDLAPVLDLPPVEAVRPAEVSAVIDATDAVRAVEVVDLQVAGLLDDAGAATADGRARPEGTVSALVAPRAPRRTRGHARTPAAASAGPDVDGPGPAA
jgi:hypothetical protein